MGWPEELQALSIRARQYPSAGEQREAVLAEEDRLLRSYPADRVVIEDFYDCFAWHNDFAGCLRRVTEGRTQGPPASQPLSEPADSGSASEGTIRAFLDSALVLIGEMEELHRAIESPAAASTSKLNPEQREKLKARFLAVKDRLAVLSARYDVIKRNREQLAAYTGEYEKDRLLRMGRILEAVARYMIYPSDIVPPELTGDEVDYVLPNGTTVEVEISPEVKRTIRQFDCESECLPGSDSISRYSHGPFCNCR